MQFLLIFTTVRTRFMIELRPLFKRKFNIIILLQTFGNSSVLNYLFSINTIIYKSYFTAKSPSIL